MVRKVLEKLLHREDLSLEEMEQIMQLIMQGQLTHSQIAGFLTALRMKGETVEEITAAAKVMRQNVVSLGPFDEFTVDTCGTGGDQSGTFNVSTTVAIVSAASGLKVAKHGNRSVSSQCGAADVLEALGIHIQMSPEEVYECIQSTDIGFLFAPTFHPAMKHVAVPRRELGIRTIFNILGPLTNPAYANGQVLGVFSPNLTEVMAKVLKNLGTERALVVHGSDGVDEITLGGETLVSELRDGEVTSYSIYPSDFGLQTAPIEAIRGGGAQENAQIIQNILQGKEQGPKREVVLLNAGAALYVGKKAESIAEGIKLAKDLIESGKAYEKLEQWIEFSKKVKK